MKKIVLLGMTLLLISTIDASGQRGKERLKLKSDTVKTDSVEYKLIVFDLGFEAWLAQKPPMTFYTKEYYEVKNRFYVTEWNYRYHNPLRYGNLYDTYIDYSPLVDYGLELNYRLYYYFLFFEQTNKVKLLGETGK